MKCHISMGQWSAENGGGAVDAPESMAKVDTTRCSTRVQYGRVKKWQLSSDDHSRILRMLSETLDDEVAAAVQNVGGRS